MGGARRVVGRDAAGGGRRSGLGRPGAPRRRLRRAARVPVLRGLARSGVPGPPRGAGDDAVQPVGVVVDEQHVGVVAGEEPGGDRVVEERHQRVPVARDVEQPDRLVVDAQLQPGERLEQLLERSRAAGQHHEAVGLVHHPQLALVHRADDVQLAQPGVADLLVLQALRDDADDLGARVERGVGQRAHRPDGRAAVHQAEAAGGEPAREVLGRGDVRRVVAGAGAEVDADPLHGLHVSNVREVSDVQTRARHWLAEDPDPATREELETLLAREDDEAAAELADRFGASLEFGTAGLRGRLGAGPNRMNRVVVQRAAAGLAAYLRDTGADGPVVIGYDARHNSEVFARDTAAVVSGAGFPALLLPRPLPTPVLAFAIRDLGCAAGVMVTASHNPPQDNGYKVYLGDGSQIVPPADAGIAERIEAVGPLADLPRGEDVTVLGEDVLERYEEAVTGLVTPGGPRELSVVYTPMHGVGGDLAARVLQRAGFAAPHVVVRQAEPDPDFPTVAFPNPEEPGAMDLALELAAEVGADLVVANDPDADRCAVAVPVEGQGWRVLRGDEVGALLAHHRLHSGVEGVYAASIVSSSLLGRMAEAAGQRHAETLTGFKWIGRVEDLAFGYEEALGYCVDPAHVRDKDGVSAMLLVCEMAAGLKTRGETLLDVLDRLATQHGLHATDQLSVRFDDLAQIPATMQRLRTQPPTSLGGLGVLGVDDLAEGSADLPPTDGLRFRLDAGARVVVRPSGTEPKVKCYLEVVVPVEHTDADDQPVAAARIVAAQRLDAVKADLKAAAGL
ncbi:hypothetical protein LUZ63_020154 [Rhynchospora breviuscula]|uniref:phosphoglucomutase (alpha-D-glucose-1,6-bisphosphate-dependent) n=1 Tax=Rhynchospora breviuscula TaxID=2022672 RepID=A0A9P9Z8P3_9POAL|nr:hypothetical protein LUZ63_020154 [Rhynchospora breviuscula]